MRIVFLTLTIILLTSPLFGGSHQPANLYRWETVSGIVWKGFGDKDINPQYLGEVDKGKPHGVGILRYTNGEKYVGEFKNGVEHGIGTKFMFFDSYKKMWIQKYVGEWKKGKPWNGWIYDNINTELKKYANGKVVVDLIKSN